MHIILTGSNDPKFIALASALKSHLEGHTFSHVDANKLTVSSAEQADLFICAHRFDNNKNQKSTLQKISQELSKTTLAIPLDLSPINLSTDTSQKTKTDPSADFVTNESLADLDSKTLLPYIVKALSQANAIYDAKKASAAKTEHTENKKNASAAKTEHAENKKKNKRVNHLYPITAEQNIQGTPHKVSLRLAEHFILQSLIDNAGQQTIPGFQLRENFNSQNDYPELKEGSVHYFIKNLRSKLVDLFDLNALEHPTSIIEGHTGGHTKVGYELDSQISQQLVITET